MRPFPAVRKLSSCPRLGHDMQMRPDRPFSLHVGTSATKGNARSQVRRLVPSWQVAGVRIRARASRGVMCAAGW